MAQLVTVKLVRHDSTPWGFRLQGGKDFGTPLLIQKVNGGSIAEQAGLAVGDGLVTVNGHDVFNLKHKEAQDAIVQGGNCLELQVQRGGGSTWKPMVANIGATPSPLSHVSGPPSLVTKTSLAAPKYAGKPIGSGHNVNPKPFNGLPHSQLNGNSNGAVKAIVNKQYNTPVGIYSEETIAETLSAQAEVLAGGVIGVNFKKNEKNYNAQNSEVLKMVQEADAEPKSPEPVPPSSVAYFATSSHAVGGRATSPRPLTPMAQQIAYGSPTNPFVVAKETEVPTSTVAEPPNCSECGKIVVGVFVRIKDKNLHVECFKCATCGTSLKNVGYYNIHNKLYCDIHAKMIARQNPPAPNLEPVTVSPGGRIPSNVVSNAVSCAMSPKSNQVSSPFQTPNTNVLSPKSFNGTSAPLTPPISSNFSRPQTVEESKSSCKINSSSWQTYSSGDGLCPSPLPSTPGYILPSSKQSPPVTENINPLFASLPSASKVEPGTNCLSPAPLPSVQGYISPSLREPVNPNPLFASLPCASRVQPGTNCLSPAPLPSVPGYVSPTPRSTTPHQKTAASLSTHSVQQSQVSHETRYTSVKSSKQEECRQQKSTEECYGTPCSIKQLKPTLQTQSPCMWSGSSREVSHSELSTAKSLSSKLETTMMMNTIKETGRWSPVPPVDPALSQQFPTNLSFTTYETQESSGYVPPHINKAAVPSFLCKPAPAPPVISFPPTFDPTPVVLEYSRSRSSTPLPTKTYEIKSELPSPAVQKHESFSADETSVGKKPISEVSTFVQNTEEKPLASEPPCQRKYIAEVRSSTTKFDTSFLSKTEETPPGVLPVSMSNPHDETMSSNQSQSVSLPSESSPYYPEFMREKPEPKVFRPEPPPSGSPLLFALTTAPGRSYSPLPSLTKPPTPPPVNSLPDFQTELPVIPGVRPVSMLAALTVASERPYSPMPYYPPAHSVSAKPKEESSVKSNDEKTALKDDTKKSEKTIFSKKGIEITISRDENDVYSDERYVSQKPELKGKQCVKIPRQDSPSRISYTNSGLHKPSTIPPYQQTLGDGTYMPRSRSPQPPHSTNVSEKSSAEAQPSGHSKVTTDSAHSSKSETKQLKSCVKSSQSQSSIDCSKSTCKQTGQICSKKVTISEAASTPPPAGMAPSKPPVCEPSVCQRSVCEPSVCQRSVCESSVCQPSVCQRSVCEPSVCQRSVCEPSVCQRSVCEPSVCQRSVCEPSVCQRSICEPSVCAKRESEATETLAKTCPYFISKAERISSSYATVENTNQTNVEKQLSSQTASKQVCALSSSQTSEKKVSMSESHSSTIATVCSSSQVKSISTSTGLIQSEPPTVSTSKSTLTDCTRSTKADIGTSTGSSSCSKPRSSEPTQSSLPPVMSSSSISSCPLGKSSQTTSSDLSQSKPSPVTSTKLSHSTSHRLSPLAVSDIPTDGNQTSTICKTASGAQIFKPPVNPKPTEIKSTGPTETSKKQPSHTVTATAPFTQTTVSQSATSICSTQTQLSSTCKIAPGGKQSKPPVPSSGIKSVPLTEAAAQNPCPITIVTPPSTPTTVSQSPNSAFSLPRKTSASVASSLSRTLSAKIAANNNNSSSQPATIPNTGSASTPNSGAGGTTKGGTAAGLTAPRRGRGVLNPGIGPGARVPLCGQCHEHIRGPFITALGKIWCPDHFICVNEECRRPLQDIGFVEESSGLYCEYCFEKYLAPTCHKCSNKIKGDCLNAIGKHFHPECFKCAFCSKLFGNNPFFLEEGLPYCENDWNELFTTKCFACGFPIEAGDRWVEALNNNYHSPCFNCTMCKKNLEGESFYAKGGRPYCKSHAR